MDKTTPLGSIVKHKLLNVLTALTLELNDCTAPECNIAKQLVNTVNLLVEHEKILTGKAPDFFYQKTSIQDIIDTACVLSEDEASLYKTNIEFKVQNDELILVDRYHVGRALHMILHFLIPQSKTIQLEVQQNPHTLSLYHEHPDAFSSSTKNIIECLENFSLDDHEINFRLGIEILQLYKAEIAYSKNCMKIVLPVIKK